MPGQPRNAASDRYRELLAKMNNTDLNDPTTLDEVPRDLSEHFVRKDRRRLIAVPDADRYEFLEQMRAWSTVGDGQPRFDVAEFLEVAGDRLVLTRLSIEVAPGQISEQLQLVLFDEQVDRMDMTVTFDVDDRTSADAELRELNRQVLLGLI